MTTRSVEDTYLAEETTAHGIGTSLRAMTGNSAGARPGIGPSKVKYSVEELLAQLKKIEMITDQEWMESLNARKKAEMEFHDKWRDRGRLGDMGHDNDTYEHLYGNLKYYAATRNSWGYLNDRIDDVAKDKIFLDYACGNGLHTQKAARAGAKLAIGLDVSGTSVENAKRNAAKEGLTGNTFFVQADAENTKLPDDSVDVILCSGMLHHLDLSYAFHEMRRVLVPGGRVLIFDALGYNPAINLYRKLTPQMRTEWEAKHILTLKDLDFARRFFSVEDVRYWHITAILQPHIPWAAGILRAIDDVLTSIPLVRLLAWAWTFELVKAEE